MNEAGEITDLKAHPFFAGLPNRVVDALIELAEQKEYSSGAWLCREGHEADKLLLILSGTAAVELHGPQGVRRLETLGPGDAVGWSWLVQPHKWQFDIRLLGPAKVAEFDAYELRRLCEQDHTIGFHIARRLLEIVSQRLMAARVQLMDMYA